MTWQWLNVTWEKRVTGRTLPTLSVRAWRKTWAVEYVGPGPLTGTAAANSPALGVVLDAVSETVALDLDRGSDPVARLDDFADPSVRSTDERVGHGSTAVALQGRT